MNGNILPLGEILEIKEDGCLKAIIICLYKNNKAFLFSRSVGYKCPDEPAPGHRCTFIGFDSNGCCKLYDCKEQKPKCLLKKYSDTLIKNGCMHNVTMTRCEGYCSSSNEYSARTDQMNNCGCCVPNVVEKRRVEMLCETGTKVITYPVIKDCQCQSKDCRNIPSDKSMYIKLN
ncbi:intestinal mucin-like protein [Rhinoraja longicauda]